MTNVATNALAAAFFAAVAAFPSHAQVLLPAAIDDATFGPLRSGVTYVARGLVTVPAGTTQTIEAGAVVKLDAGSRLQVAGTLLANGTTTAKVWFTSLHDDSVGLPLGSRPPAPGDWTLLGFTASPASRLDWVEVRYAGAQANRSLDLVGSDLLLRNAVIRDGLGDGLAVGSSRPTVESCSIRSCSGRAIVGASFAALPAFRANTASGNGGGDAIAVQNDFDVTGTLTIGPDNGIGGVILLLGSPRILAGGSLTIVEGTILKLAPGGSILVSGEDSTLLSRGSAARPVVITSAEDDAFGGDTTGNGPTTGTPGDWSSVRLLGNAIGLRPVHAVLEHTVLRFGGRQNLAAVDASEASLTMRRCVVERSGTQGVGFRSPRRVVPVEITGCDFRDNVGPALSEMHWAILPGLRDNTASGNGGADEFVVVGNNNDGRSPTAVDGRVAVYRHCTLNGTGLVVCPGAFLADSSQELLLGPGLVLKMRTATDGFFCRSGGVLVFDGRGDAPVTVTSIKDDSLLGDTNGDGNATVPAPGDWQYALYLGADAAGFVSHARFRYGGGSPTFAGTLHCQSARVRIVSTRVDFSASSGFHVLGTADPGANWIAYRNQGAGIELRSGSFMLQHATSTENSGAGVVGQTAYTGTVYSSIAWNNGRRITRDNFVDVRHTRCNGSSLGGNINADPMFVDEPRGDLHISPLSLCVGRGDLPQATLWGEDHDGNSRILDHALNGLALPDIGAYEVFQYRMDIRGEYRLGQRIDFGVVGPGPRSGFQVALIGPAVGGAFLPPFGVLVAGDPAMTITFAAAATGQSFAVTVPTDDNLLGSRLGIQTLVVTDAALPAGGLTNAMLGTVTR